MTTTTTLPTAVVRITAAAAKVNRAQSKVNRLEDELCRAELATREAWRSFDCAMLAPGHDLRYNVDRRSKLVEVAGRS